MEYIITKELVITPYFKEVIVDNLPRLDILIYAHDGRGLGHVSRSLTIARALRIHNPALRLLFVSGSPFIGELAGREVDWVKLPAYKTKVVSGKSTGIDGESGFTDGQLGYLRSMQILDLVNLYRPRIVLADHSPQGKHRELLPALKSDAGQGAHWILGVRGVVGGVSQTLGSYSAQIFTQYYKDILWYGDSSVLGKNHLDSLQKVYDRRPKECGYVSKFADESQHGSQAKKKYAGVISLPWLGEKSARYIDILAEAIAEIGPEYGLWKVFVNREDGAAFVDIDHCVVEMPSGRYSEVLQESSLAIIYGGYNSLVDVLSLGIPSIVCLRDMRDQEQQIHLERLCATVPEGLVVVEEESVSREDIVLNVSRILEKNIIMHHHIDLGGAIKTAKIIDTFLR